MKVIIHSELQAIYEDCCGTTEEDIKHSGEEFASVSKLFSKYSVKHKIERTDNAFVLTIPVQKIVLDEKQMNDLFYNAFYLVDYKMKYGQLGGEGCDFSIDIFKKLNYAPKL